MMMVTGGGGKLLELFSVVPAIPSASPALMDMYTTIRQITLLTTFDPLSHAVP